MLFKWKKKYKMEENRFEVIKKGKGGERYGRLHTPSGRVDTPTYFVHCVRNSPPWLTADQLDEIGDKNSFGVHIRLRDLSLIPLQYHYIK